LSGAAQLPQNFIPPGFSAPQLEHRMPTTLSRFRGFGDKFAGDQSSSAEDSILDRPRGSYTQKLWNLYFTIRAGGEKWANSVVSQFENPNCFAALATGDSTFAIRTKLK
jgi:hypothetical protein